MKKNAGSYILAIEGSVPTAGGVYCSVGGVTALDYLQRAAALAKAQPEDIEDGIARIDEALDGQPTNMARPLPVLPS